MRKILMATVAVVPLAALASLSLPALAESGEGSAEAACVTQPGDASAGPIDLSQIPVKPVTGQMAVQGVGDECDDVASLGKTGEEQVGAAIGTHRESADSLGERDD